MRWQHFSQPTPKAYLPLLAAMWNLMTREGAGPVEEVTIPGPHGEDMSPKKT